MNDLAENAWHGARAAYRVIRNHPMRSFGGAGLVIGSVAVVAGGQVAALGSSRPLTTWLGLASSRTVGGNGAHAGAVLLAALVVLVALWVGFVETVRRQRQPLRRVWAVAGLWALPFALGPPLMDTSVYSYVAFGRLERLGRDPYRAGPIALGSSPIVTAIGPSTRGDQSSAGPLGTLVQHFAISVSGGRLFGALLVLRVIGVLAAFAIGRGAVRLSAPSVPSALSGVPGPSGPPATTRGTALALCLPNPLVLLYIVSSPHLEGVMVALLLTAADAARQRAWPRAVLLATVAGSVTATGFVAVPLIIAVHLVTRRRARRWQALGRDAAVAVATVAVTRLAVPDGFGWVRTVRGQFDQHTPFAIADAVGRLISPVVRGASYDDLAAGGRVTAAAAALGVVGYLVLTPRARSLDAGIGYALLALALLAPVLHPWYLMWGVLVFAPLATGPRRTWVLALTAAGCVLSPPGFAATTSDALTGVGLGVVAIVAGSVLVVQNRAAHATSSESLPAESKSDESVRAESASAGDLTHGGANVGEVDAGDHGRGE